MYSKKTDTTIPFHFSLKVRSNNCSISVSTIDGTVSELHVSNSVHWSQVPWIQEPYPSDWAQSKIKYSST